jgi:hypothetical protein
MANRITPLMVHWSLQRLPFEFLRIETLSTAAHPSSSPPMVTGRPMVSNHSGFMPISRISGRRTTYVLADLMAPNGMDRPSRID